VEKVVVLHEGGTSLEEKWGGERKGGGGRELAWGRGPPWLAALAKKKRPATCDLRKGWVGGFGFLRASHIEGGHQFGASFAK
jgi:hypothetical protein